MTSDLARIEVTDLAGVFAARQLGRGIAGQLALESQDQVRVATALSEISRSAVMAGQRAVVAFAAANGRPGDLGQPERGAAAARGSMRRPG